MGRIDCAIWNDTKFRALTDRQQLLLLGYMTLSGWRRTARGKPEELQRLLFLYEDGEMDQFRADLAALEDAGLVGQEGSDAKYVRFADKPPKRGPLAKHLRKAVIDRDGMICRLCGKDIPEGDLHIDHIFPVALGGTDDLDNLQPAHSRCNISKGARV